jgi:hypothetical protein
MHIFLPTFGDIPVPRANKAGYERGALLFAVFVSARFGCNFYTMKLIEYEKSSGEALIRS